MSKRIVFPRSAAPLTLVAIGAALTLAGCAAASTGTGTGGVSNATSSFSATPGASAGSTAGAGQAGAAGAGSSSTAGTGGGNSGGGSGSGASACLLSGLSIQLGPDLSPASAVLVAQAVKLTNKGSSACTVLGWPGVAGLSGGGSQVFQAIRVGSEGSQITLQPGATASAMIYIVPSLGAGGPVCEAIPNLLVTPPNETHSQQVSLALSMCAAPALSALLPGSGSATPSGAAAFAEAKGLWQAGAPASSANQGAYWTEGATVLKNAVSEGASGTSGFSTAAQQLTQLASLPDAMQTPTQNAEYHSDINALNSFFGTPNLYS